MSDVTIHTVLVTPQIHYLQVGLTNLKQCFGERKNNMFSVIVEWHLKGTCIWIASVFGIVVNLILMFKKLRHPKKYSSATIFAIMIAASGIGMIIMEQATFLSEHTSPVTAPDWLRSLRKFTQSPYCAFLRNFFPHILDFSLVTNSINLYILICRPQNKDFMLSVKMIGAGIICNVGLSAIFASLAAKLEHDIDNGPGLFLLTRDKTLPTWISKVTLVLSISFLTTGSYIFFTYKIKLTLEKSIKFLQESNASGHAAEKYKKIVRFCLMSCVMFGFYNLLVETMAMICMIIRASVATGIFSYLFGVSLDRLLLILSFFGGFRYVNNIIICLQPACFGITFVTL